MSAGTTKEFVREVRLSTNSESTNRQFPLDHEKDFVEPQSYWVSHCRPDVFSRGVIVVLMFSLVGSSIPFTQARFTSTTCVATECIQQNAAGAWCYIPISGMTRATSCNGGTGESTEFATVLEVHLAQSLSIGYYNGVDNTFLGGANYPISATPGIIRLCASGRSGDGNLQTLCVNAVADNVLGGGAYCHVLRGQNNVSDGCYNPNEVVRRPTITSSYASFGGSPTVTVTVTRFSGARINTVLTLRVLLLAIMVGLAC